MRVVTRAAVAEDLDSRERYSEQSPQERPIEEANLLERIGSGEFALDNEDSLSGVDEEIRLGIPVTVAILKVEPLAVVEDAVLRSPPGDKLTVVFDDKVKFPSKEL